MDWLLELGKALVWQVIWLCGPIVVIAQIMRWWERGEKKEGRGRGW